jgi:beta-lactamase regulating signal transducer with metallopeptidase domain
MNFQALNHAVETGFGWTWKTSLQATVLIALVWVVQLFFKRALTPRWRYALGLLILLRLALPILPASPLSIFNLTKHLPTRAPLMTAPVIVPEPANFDSPPARVETVLPRKPVINFPMAAYVWLAGCAAMLAWMAIRQRKLTRQLRAQSPLTEPRVLAPVEDCKKLLGIKRPVAIVATKTLSTPALFGIWRPRLLMPEGMLTRLDERELRLIFLHELTHLKHGDIFANWAMIILRSLHWFNPFVWLALRRLRADQELACDAAVMARLADGERRLYGDTLIKMLAEFSASPFCPGLVPFITNKKLIKRRITMIAKFKPGGRTALIASITLLVALGFITFTRASDKPLPPPAAASAAAAQDKAHVETSERTIHALQNELDELTVQVDASQRTLNEMRRGLNIPSEIAEGKAVSKVDGETMRHYQVVLADSESQYVREEVMLKQLRKMSAVELRDALPTAAPDTLLNSLLEQLSQAETKLLSLRGDFGDQHPDVQKAKAAVDNLEKKVNDRVKGILAGMAVRVDSLKAAVDETSKRIEMARKADSSPLDEYQPFFQKKRDLETLQKTRDALITRLNQEKIDFTVLQSAQVR